MVVAVELVSGDCNRNTGPAGTYECVLLPPYYSKYQWSTCLTDEYIQWFSKKAHHCRDRTTVYCWYQCMIETHDLEKGPVYDDCACGPDAPTGGTTQPTVMTTAIPEWCFSPSGTECSWYRECLEKRYPCKETGNSYALDYAEKFCNLYVQHYSEFDNTGQQWIDGVRRCLQVELVPILRPFVRKTCEQIKQMAFDSHPGCYLNPNEGKPSICEIGVTNWAKVFWTVKSAVLQAPTATFKQMVQVMQACGGEILTKGMELIQLKITEVKDDIKRNWDEFSDNVTKKLSEKTGWIKKGILYFVYPFSENHKLNKRSTDNDTDESLVFINILIAERSQFDLNDEGAPTTNVSAAAIDFARAVEKGDVRLDEDGVVFTDLSICANSNCTETSLQVKPAPQKDETENGINVTTVVIVVCVAIVCTALITVIRLALRKMRKF